MKTSRLAGELEDGYQFAFPGDAGWAKRLTEFVVSEIARQEEILRGGGEIEQETLHFDPRSERITSLRSKEEAHDYRYFPEPDLVPVVPTEEMRLQARAALPELPAARAERYATDWDIQEDTARLFA